MINSLVKEFIEKNENNINLIASENVTICDCSQAYQKEIMLRYVSNDNSSGATFSSREQLDKIKQMAINKLCELLDARFINIEPISGINCMLYAIGGLTKLGDVVYSVPLDCGGHGVTKPLIEKIGLKHKFLPFDKENQEIDFKKLAYEVEICRPRMIYLDFMNICWNINVKKLKRILPKEVILIYDASHVMGLILGKAFDNPLTCNADIVIGSMHKTYPGVHKGIIATNKRTINKLLLHNGALYVSHDHISDIIALGLSLEEFEKKGYDYANKVVSNAKYFSKCLKENGLEVSEFEQKFTDTHQIWLKCGTEEMAINFLTRLMEYGIYANVIQIPFYNGYGIRLGIQEVTLLGYSENDFSMLAKKIAKIMRDK